MRVLVVIGTRPEAIKMMPLILELKKYGAIETLVCHSGQHRELARSVFDFFGVTPDFSFSAMREGQSLCELSARLLNYFDALIGEISPSLVLVHGDTTTAYCAALAAFYRGVDVAHIEAGLRTHNIGSPHPEEFNRVSVDAVSRYCFAPTELAAQNLTSEGKSLVFTVGNTVIDTFKYTLREDYTSPLTEAAKGRKILLVTSHRRENIGARMESALLGLRDILSEREDLFAILPTHPNPAVRSVVNRLLRDIKNIKICDPLPLYDFHNTLASSFAVMSDSGGVQEEAAYLGVPLFLLRDTTERPECIAGGNLVMLGTDRSRVREVFLSITSDESLLGRMKNRSLAFGDGHASEKIVQKLLSFTKNDAIMDL